MFDILQCKVNQYIYVLFIKYCNRPQGCFVTIAHVCRNNVIRNTCVFIQTCVQSLCNDSGASAVYNVSRCQAR